MFSFTRLNYKKPSLSAITKHGSREMLYNISLSSRFSAKDSTALLLALVSPYHVDIVVKYPNDHHGLPLLNLALEASMTGPVDLLDYSVIDKLGPFHALSILFHGQNASSIARPRCCRGDLLGLIPRKAAFCEEPKIATTIFYRQMYGNDIQLGEEMTVLNTAKSL
ncbi:hypothetical protein BDQ17DRAFT_1326117 [Cyathus striatus]|nr:hypothetical protein BDQ17DRAFT_1326117 [Cyathus striatus]